ncbi:hypothetical protein J7K43_06975 [Candidatus Calescamantes bacterium]|nr:hypothetical protein [Candidatus Calescamantes bacterium]
MKEPLYQNIVYKKFIHKRVKILEPRLNNSLQILILGTSRTLTGLSPQIITQELSLPPHTVLNFSLPAESYRDIYTVLKNHLKELKRVPLVIIEISPFQFFYPYSPYIEEKGGMIDKISWSFIYRDFHMLPKSLFLSYRRRDFVRGYLLRWCRSLARVIKGENPRKIEEESPFVIKDFQPIGEGWVAAIGKLRKEWEKIDLMDRKLFPQPSTKEREWRNFLKMVHLVEKEQLRVLFIEMPVKKEVEKEIIARDPSLYKFFQQRVKPFLKDKGYLILEGNKELKIDEEGFYDYNHLNKEGAMELSKEFSYWLRKKGILQ